MQPDMAEEQRQLVGIARELGPSFAKRALGYDRDAAFPTENFRELREAGLLKLTVPRDYGGHGYWQKNHYLGYYLVLAEVARYCSSTAQLLQVHSHGVGIVAGLGSDAQRRRYMPEVVEEGRLFASCGSEASVRKSGPESFDCILRRAGQGYSLTGFKGFASLAPEAGYYVIWALAEGKTKMEDGVVFTVVPEGREGVQLENNWDTLGMRPTVSWSIRLKNCLVAEDEVIGKPGDWVQQDPRTFTLGYAANHVGQARAVYDFVAQYLGKRQDLSEAPTIQVEFGDAEVKISATEALVKQAAWLWEAGDYDAAELASMRALHMAKQASLGLATKAFDICGARSTFNDQMLSLYYRDIRTFTLHFREDRLLQMLTEANLGGDFHSKQRYGRRLAPLGSTDDAA